MRLIPLTSLSPRFTFRIDLGDTAYKISMTYNVRSEEWQIKIDDGEGRTVIDTGAAIGFNYLEYEEDAPGALAFVYFGSGVPQKCGRDDLGNDWKLFFQGV